MEPDSNVCSVPKLSALSADVIAKFPATVTDPPSILFRKSLENPFYRLRYDVEAIPLPVSESLLNAFRRNCSRRAVNLLTSKLLGLFLDCTRTPLLNLDLEGSSVDDVMLANLLNSHGRNLLYLNLSGCVELTESLNSYVEDLPAKLNLMKGSSAKSNQGSISEKLQRLRILDLGNLIKLFSPWLRGEGMEDIDDSGDEEDDAHWRAFAEAMKTDPSLLHQGNAEMDAGDAADELEELMSDQNDSDAENVEIPNSVLDSIFMDVDVVEQPNGTASNSQKAASMSDDDEEWRSSSSSPPISDSRHKLLERSSTVTLSTKHTNNGRERKFSITRSCPNLLALILHGDELEDQFPDATANIVAEFFLCLLHYTRRLLYLDLSYWSKMSDLRFLRPQRYLQTLVVFDVPDLYQAVNVICSLTTLKHLDISQSERETGQYPRPVTTLNRIITSLPHLTSLDISSTNLASNPTKGDFIKQKFNAVESDIVGLRSLRKPLEYLGIFYCDIAAHYHRIPAVKVAGDANENQILLAIEQYMKRPTLLLKVLNEAYQIYRFGSPTRYGAALNLMLESMSNHVKDASIQIASSASIFYIIRNVNMNATTKKRVVNALLTGHLSEQTMVRNCCLSLCQFEVPNDLLFDYTRAARLLLRVIDEFQDQMTQRIVVYLLNSMACHVEGEQKVAVGELNAVERILNVIRRRHDADICDEVMEVSWSFLWNITDETPANCDRFLRNGGMKLFYECYKKFPEKNELLRNMMGLMGNIAEVQEMRSHLMQGEYVSVFCELLKNMNDGIEISYNSAGVLSHMLSDGPSAWQAVDPSREEATQAVIAAIEMWQLNARRFINYRSFEPILRLVPLFQCPASQYWSVWALANLTTVDGTKYCQYVIHEGGLPLLERAAVESRASKTVRDLAKKVLDNVREWSTEHGVQ